MARTVTTLAALAFLPSLALAVPLAACLAQAAPASVPTDIFIREQAGLPAAWAKGEIEILDVGHHPLDTMISIVANRAADGWHVSYACAQSPHGAAGADHLAREYVMAAPASGEIDRILANLMSGAEPDGMKPSSTFIGGQLLVSIRYRGFSREYRRVGAWGRILGRLEQLLAQPAQE